MGTMLVFERRNRPMLGNVIAIHPTTKKTPAVVVNGRAAIGKGQRRSKRTPMRTASAYHSGGGTRLRDYRIVPSSLEDLSQ